MLEGLFSVSIRFQFMQICKIPAYWAGQYAKLLEVQSMWGGLERRRGRVSAIRTLKAN